MELFKNDFGEMALFKITKHGKRETRLSGF
jgi:hypothetical protein